MSESENKNAFQNLDTEPFTTALTGKISLSPIPIKLEGDPLTLRIAF